MSQLPVLPVLEELPTQRKPAPAFNVERYLAEERANDLLRFSTAGSVDDGKSTLIGRLLYDTQGVYEGQVRSIAGKGTTAPGVLDFALLTDGLRAERERERAALAACIPLPLLRDGAAQVHHCRHARARAIHAQYGHRSQHRRRGHCAGGRAQGPAEAVAPSRGHHGAAGRATDDGGRQQKWTWWAGVKAPSGRCACTLRSFWTGWSGCKEPLRRRRFTLSRSARWAAITSSSARMRCPGMPGQRCWSCSKRCLPPPTGTLKGRFALPCSASPARTWIFAALPGRSARVRCARHGAGGFALGPAQPGGAHRHV